MGSLDVSSAKQQFFELVDALSASHLPSFTIWLDAKLAEYKTIGQLKPDSEYESKEQYPEWIGKALRQNLSFLFPGASQTSSFEGNAAPSADSDSRKRRPSQLYDILSEKKRSRQSSFVHDRHETVGCGDDGVMMVKEEPGEQEKSDYSRVTDTPLPGIQSTFSLSAEPIRSFSGEQSAVFSFTTPSKSLTSSPATMTPQNQTLSASLPQTSLSDKSDNHQGSSSKRVNFDSASAHPQSMPLFSPSAVATKLEASPHSSAPSPGIASAAYPVSWGAAPLSYVEGSEGAGPQGITDDVVQDATMKFHGGKPTCLVASQDLKKKDNGRYACPICEKESRTVCDYRRHFVRHTNERPFHCPYCCKLSRTLDSLYKHHKSHHPDKPRVKVDPIF